jgi:hypothetical protein
VDAPNPCETWRFRHVSAGTIAALRLGTVNGVRIRLSALVVVVSFIATISAPTFAESQHLFCAAKQHDCGKVARISNCCCGGASDSAKPNGPVEARVQLTVSLAPVSVLPLGAISAPADNSIVRVHLSAPRSAPVDFPTLFATLLI